MPSAIHAAHPRSGAPGSLSARPAQRFHALPLLSCIGTDLLLWFEDSIAACAKSRKARPGWGGPSMRRVSAGACAAGAACSGSLLFAAPCRERQAEQTGTEQRE